MENCYFTMAMDSCKRCCRAGARGKVLAMLIEEGLTKETDSNLPISDNPQDEPYYEWLNEF